MKHPSRRKLDKKRRTLVVGDIHGCLADLNTLLKEAGFREGRDRLVCVGDLVDRGPDSVGVLRRVRELKGHTVLGNHEEKHLRYHRHYLRAKADPTYKIPMSMPHPEAHLQMTEEDFDYIASMPLTIDIGDDITVVHGGFSRDIPRWRPTLQACRVRYVDSEGDWFEGMKWWEQPAHTTFWADSYRGKRNVIYGHEPRRDVYWTVRDDGVWTLGLDTSCVFGNKLTGYWLGSQTFVTVPSTAKYGELKTITPAAA